MRLWWRSLLWLWGLVYMLRRTCLVGQLLMGEPWSFHSILILLLDKLWPLPFHFPIQIHPLLGIVLIPGMLLLPGRFLWSFPIQNARQASTTGRLRSRSWRWHGWSLVLPTWCRDNVRQLGLLVLLLSKIGIGYER